MMNFSNIVAEYVPDLGMFLSSFLFVLTFLLYQVFKTDKDASSPAVGAASTLSATRSSKLWWYCAVAVLFLAEAIVFVTIAYAVVKVLD